jgi:hypothetical protein
MIDALIVARSNRYGMRHDCEILAEAVGWPRGRVLTVHSRRRNFLDWLLRRRIANHLLFIERVFPIWYSAAAERWLVPNQERFPHRHIHRLAHVGCVLAKTRHAQQIFSSLGAETVLLGFTSEDCLEPCLEKDWNGFLHMAGGSTVKGTEELVDLWRRHPQWPELVLVQSREHAPRDLPSNIRLLPDYLPREKLRELQNRCGIHLCPSRSEGWGHYIVEAMSVGAVVLTTDAPPMNEHITPDCGILVPYCRSEPRHLGTNFFVDPVELERAIEALIKLSPASKRAMGLAARARFLAIDAAFRARAHDLFSG